MSAINKTLEYVFSKKQMSQLSAKELGTLINKKLDYAIQFKIASGDLKFSNDGTISRPTTIDLSRFGLKNPNDIKIFLLSPAGNAVIHKIAVGISLEKKSEEERQQQIQEQLIAQEQKRSLIFHWLLYAEKKESKLAQKELIEQQNKALQQKSQPILQKSTSKTNTSFDLILANYNEAIQSYQEKYQELQREELTIGKDLDKLIQMHQVILAEHNTYEESLNQIEAKISKYEKDPQKLTKKIKNAEKHIHKLTEKINQASLQGNEEKRNKLLEQHCIAIIKSDRLKEIQEQRDKDMLFIDDNGQEVIPNKNATFRIPRNSRLCIKKGTDGKHYLLDSNQSMEELEKPENKNIKDAARAQFENSKHKLISVKKRIARNKENKLHFNNSLIEDTRIKLATNKAEQLMLENQIHLTQIASHNAAKAALKTMQQSTPNMNATMEPPKQPITTENMIPNFLPTQKPSQILSTSAFTKIIDEEKPTTWGKLFDIFNKIAPKVKKEVEELLPEEIKQILKALKNSPEDIKKSLSQAPIPDLIMNNFLKNMSYMNSSSSLKQKEDPLFKASLNSKH